MKADLSGANLYKADLSDANLYKADLREANLSAIIGIEILTATLFKHAASDRIQTGCQDYSVDYWIEHGEAIGEEHRYDDYDIENYMSFIKYVKSRGILK